MPDLYIGKVFKPADKSLGDRFLLKASDLTTHGIVIGMTGSGKTGLAVDMIEETLKANVPVIVIDPKGDMGNLAFAFDRLAPEQFAPWVDTDAAKREGQTVDEAARKTAETWSKGLADWGIGPNDVAAYAAGHRVRIFTPGSSTGIPLNLIDSLDAPDGDFDTNAEEYRDEIDSLVTALLGFIKVTADPISSREYILLFTLIESAWRQGQSLTVESLIGRVANPPIERVGALPVDSFYPPADRQKLMMGLNNLIASPPFQEWRRGERIDVGRWVRSEDGRPQLTIVYTAHLDDEERLFITALILNKLKTWMRKQPGTSELRCLFYMDEIFGYFPPTANPPTKKPLLTLLKQARAYGVAVVLSTQNPVDLDYKGLANMGFWAIGRLQTTQDQARIREGIEAALADSAMGKTFDSLIASVQKRVFLIHDIHRSAPELVQSRWAMSYLRGPVTRDEIRELTPADERRAAMQADATPPGLAGAAAPAAARTSAPAAVAPILPAPLQSRYCRRHGGTVANPYVYVKAAVRYKVGGALSDEATRELAFPLSGATTANEVMESEPLEIDEGAMDDAAPAGVVYGDLPPFLQRDSKVLERALKDRLDDRLEVSLLYDAESKTISRPGEDEASFTARLTATAGSSPKRAALERKLADRRMDLAAKQSELKSRKSEKWLSIFTTILSNIGLLTGRKKTVTGAGTVLTKNRMENTAEAKAEGIAAEIAAMEAQLKEMSEVDPAGFERRIVKPAKTDVAIIRYDVVWVY